MSQIFTESHIESKGVPLYKNLPKLQHQMIKQNNETQLLQQHHKKYTKVGRQHGGGDPLYYTASPEHQSTYLHCKEIKSDADFRQKLCSGTA
jgi:hypothetical protein